MFFSQLMLLELQPKFVYLVWNFTGFFMGFFFPLGGCDWEQSKQIIANTISQCFTVNTALRRLVKGAH